jgi:hypothetical protein
MPDFQITEMSFVDMRPHSDRTIAALERAMRQYIIHVFGVPIGLIECGSSKPQVICKTTLPIRGRTKKGGRSDAEDRSPVH